MKDLFSLAGRTALILIPTLIAVEFAGLLILSADRIELQLLADSRDFGRRVVALYRTMVLQPEAWTAAVRDLDPSVEASIEDGLQAAGPVASNRSAKTQAQLFGELAGASLPSNCYGLLMDIAESAPSRRPG